MRNGDHNVARLHSRRHQGKAQRVGTAAHRDRVCGLAKGGKVLFEIFHHGPADKARGAQRFVKYGGKLRLQFNVRGHEIEKRNAVGIYRIGVRLTHFVASMILAAGVSPERRNFAGFPATILLAATSRVTTLPAPTMAFSPMVRLGRMVAPDPIDAPFLTVVRSTFQSASVCNWPLAVDRG